MEVDFRACVLTVIIVLCNAQRDAIGEPQAKSLDGVFREVASDVTRITSEARGKIANARTTLGMLVAGNAARPVAGSVGKAVESLIYGIPARVLPAVVQTQKMVLDVIKRVTERSKVTNSGSFDFTINGNNVVCEVKRAEGQVENVSRCDDDTVQQVFRMLKEFAENCPKSVRQNRDLEQVGEGDGCVEKELVGREVDKDRVVARNGFHESDVMVDGKLDQKVVMVDGKVDQKVVMVDGKVDKKEVGARNFTVDSETEVVSNGNEDAEKEDAIRFEVMEEKGRRNESVDNTGVIGGNEIVAENSVGENESNLSKSFESFEQSNATEGDIEDGDDSNEENKLEEDYESGNQGDETVVLFTAILQD